MKWRQLLQNEFEWWNTALLLNYYIQPDWPQARLFCSNEDVLNTTVLLQYVCWHLCYTPIQSAHSPLLFRHYLKSRFCADCVKTTFLNHQTGLKSFQQAVNRRGLSLITSLDWTGFFFFLSHATD